MHTISFYNAENSNPLVGAEWPAIPRVGEFILFRDNYDADWQVEAVRWRENADETIAIEVFIALVEDE
ncbi:MAG: hypothetical protein AAFY60_18630 [Myxococcota bacterium]